MKPIYYALKQIMGQKPNLQMRWSEWFLWLSNQSPLRRITLTSRPLETFQGKQILTHFILHNSILKSSLSYLLEMSYFVSSSFSYHFFQDFFFFSNYFSKNFFLCLVPYQTALRGTQLKQILNLLKAIRYLKTGWKGK